MTPLRPSAPSSPIALHLVLVLGLVLSALARPLPTAPGGPGGDSLAIALAASWCGEPLSREGDDQPGPPAGHGPGCCILCGVGTGTLALPPRPLVVAAPAALDPADPAPWPERGGPWLPALPPGTRLSRAPPFA